MRVKCGPDCFDGHFCFAREMPDWPNVLRARVMHPEVASHRALVGCVVTCGVSGFGAGVVGKLGHPVWMVVVAVLGMVAACAFRFVGAKFLIRRSARQVATDCGDEIGALPAALVTDALLGPAVRAHLTRRLGRRDGELAAAMAARFEGTVDDLVAVAPTALAT